MSTLDRLSALIARFALHVDCTPTRDPNLIIAAASVDAPASRLRFRASGTKALTPPRGTTVVFSATTSWGGTDNPLLAALPEVVDMNLDDDPNLRAICELVLAESRDQRCGSTSVVDRLGEVLLVRMLRAQLEVGSTKPGLLAGLADERLSPALVALHEHPGHPWTNPELASVAGLSLSRFTELFGTVVGQTPMSYVRLWRLTLAHQDVIAGDRIQHVARRYGYSSAEAFTRAFRQHYGTKPTALRQAA